MHLSVPNSHNLGLKCRGSTFVWPFLVFDAPLIPFDISCFGILDYADILPLAVPGLIPWPPAKGLTEVIVDHGLQGSRISSPESPASPAFLYLLVRDPYRLVRPVPNAHAEELGSSSSQDASANVKGQVGHHVDRIFALIEISAKI